MDRLNIERWRGLLTRVENLEQDSVTQRDNLTRIEVFVRDQGELIKRLSGTQTEPGEQWSATVERLHLELERLRLELARLGRELESEHRRADRLFGWLVATQPEPLCETSHYFGPPGSRTGKQDSLEDHPIDSDDMAIVDLKIFRVTASRPPATNPHATQDAWQDQEYIAVQRAIGPTEAPAPHLLVSAHFVPEHSNEFGAITASEPDEDSDRSLEQRFQDAFDEYVTKKIFEPTWERSTEIWVTPVGGDVASVAETISGSCDQWHELILGEPVRSAGQLIDLNPEAGDAIAGIASEFTLPGDSLIKEIKRVVQITGIVMGVAAHQPLLVNACVKSLAHDIMFEAAREVIEDVITDALSPAGTQERDLEGSQAICELTRQTEEIQAWLKEARIDEPSAKESLAPHQIDANEEVTEIQTDLPSIAHPESTLNTDVPSTSRTPPLSRGNFWSFVDRPERRIEPPDEIDPPGIGF